MLERPGEPGPSERRQSTASGYARDLGQLGHPGQSCRGERRHFGMSSVYIGAPFSSGTRRGISRERKPPSRQFMSDFIIPVGRTTKFPIFSLFYPDLDIQRRRSVLGGGTNSAKEAGEAASPHMQAKTASRARPSNGCGHGTNRSRGNGRSDFQSRNRHAWQSHSKGQTNTTRSAEAQRYMCRLKQCSLSASASLVSSDGGCKLVARLTGVC